MKAKDFHEYGEIRYWPSFTRKDNNYSHYLPKSSGFLKGHGVNKIVKRKNRSKKHQIADYRISDTSIIKELVPNFDPELEQVYTERDIKLITEKILLLDEKSPYEQPCWLPMKTYLARMRKEVYNKNGVADPDIASGLYWRTHPEGRKVATEDARIDHSSGFYTN